MRTPPVQRQHNGESHSFAPVSPIRNVFTKPFMTRHLNNAHIMLLHLAPVSDELVPSESSFIKRERKSSEAERTNNAEASVK